MPLLFSYGTLQDADVQLAIFGRVLTGRPDELVGYERSLVPIGDAQYAAATGRTHHANVVSSGDTEHRVTGTVLEVTDAELATADDYERVHEYERVNAPLASGRESWVYLHPRPS